MRTLLTAVSAECITVTNSIAVLLAAEFDAVIRSSLHAVLAVSAICLLLHCSELFAGVATALVSSAFVIGGWRDSYFF